MPSVFDEGVSRMMDRYMQEIGLNPETIFNKERNAWYWSRGSANIEVFVESIDMSGGTQRRFLRVFSPLVKVPPNAGTAFYRRLLELNDKSLGVKLTLLASTDTIYATYERDVKGMEYSELSDTIADVEWWGTVIKHLFMKYFNVIVIAAALLCVNVISQDHNILLKAGSNPLTGIVFKKVNNSAPSEYDVYQGCPNAFGRSTLIRLDVPRKSDIEVKLYDLKGNFISTLLNKSLKTGVYSIEWEPSENAGGVYFCELTSGSVKVTKKMILSK
jgi:hypothetical protein